MDLSAITVVVELESMGWKYDWSSEDEVRCCCPFHDDSSPSLHINVRKRVFKCQAAGCGVSGDFVNFYARALKTNRVTAIADLATRYEIVNTKTINVSTVEKYWSKIYDSPGLVKELTLRGITSHDIDSYRLGVDQNRITIPVKNENGVYINVRRYLPGAKGKDKIKNTRGYGKPRLYPIEQLAHDEIVIAGGEIKAIAAAAQLNRHRIGAISTTTGEGNWDKTFTKAFEGKRVWVCLDIDSAGVKASESLARTLQGVAHWVGVVNLPLDLQQFPHGDINDFVYLGGQLFPILQECPQYEPTLTKRLTNSEPLKISLYKAVSAENTGVRFEVNGTVAAIHEAPFTVPSKVLCKCDRDQPFCNLCPVFTYNENEQDIHAESEALLQIVGHNKTSKGPALMEAIGIPALCKTVSFEELAYYHVEDARINPEFSVDSMNSDRMMQPAIVIGEGLEANSNYKFVGRMYPNPKSQESTLILSQFELTEDALESYKPEDVKHLEFFRPKDWSTEGLSSRLHHLYSDLETNVTRIFHRRALHLAMDLSYHSPLLINFDGKQNIRGWVETLIVGDSAQGKSDTAESLMRFYSLGEKLDCKNATVAGLLGGLQQMGTGKQWYVTWGAFPNSDRMLLILEELKGCPVEVISKLTDMRQSGIAQLPKIKNRKAHARTRMIALSNPRTADNIDSYNYGIEAIRDLIGNPEDVRRFDLGLILSRHEIRPEQLNMLQIDRESIEHVHTKSLCRELILWAWTRKATTYEPDVERLIVQKANRLTDVFTDRIPLVDRGSIRYKLARLASSLAARTFSCDEAYESVLVRPCHVEFIADFIEKTYSSSVLGYRSYTESINKNSRLLDEAEINQLVNSLAFPQDFVDQILLTGIVDMQAVQDWCSCDRIEAQRILSFLLRKHAIVRKGRNYVKTSRFTVYLKGFTPTARPDFIPEIKETF